MANRHTAHLRLRKPGSGGETCRIGEKTPGGPAGPASFPRSRWFRKRTLHDRIARRTHGALWNCPAYGRPVSVALNPEVGEAGAHRPLAMRSSGLCGVDSAARVDAGDYVERYSA